MVNGPYGMFPSTRYPDPGADMPSVDVLSETGGTTTVVVPASDEGGSDVDASAAASRAEDPASCAVGEALAASCAGVLVASPASDRGVFGRRRTRRRRTLTVTRWRMDSVLTSARLDPLVEGAGDEGFSPS